MVLLRLRHLAGVLACVPALVASQQIVFSKGGEQQLIMQDDPTSATAASMVHLELPYEPITAKGSAASSESVEDVIRANRGSHVTLTHRDLPGMSVRIKNLRSKDRNATHVASDSSDPEAFCDDVQSWSGYIDAISGESLFFYFFESRSNPDKDPVLLWTNGGPGCSSAIGLFQELGPCRVKEGSSKHSKGPPINGTEINPYSWNTRMNTIFIDQPVGVGLSYHRYGGTVGSTEVAAKNIYQFLRIFFTAFDRFSENDFHLSGESYAGRYVPIFASEVVDRNQEILTAAAKAGKKPKKHEIIPLKSVLIGNGLTDISRQVPKYFDFTCTKLGGQRPVLSIETCTRMRVYKDRCARELGEHCRDNYNPDKCAEMNAICMEELGGPYAATKRNPYNIEDDCKAGLEPNLCYPVTEDIRNYLNRGDVRSLIGAAPVEEIGEFKSCNMKMNQAFHKAEDDVLDNSRNIAALLERDIPILIYVGTLDWICNYLGNRAWVESLDWSGRSEFGASGLEALKTWRVDGKKAGQTQSGGGLTWATIFGAGHMVPYDKPAESLAMLHRWIDGEEL